MNVADLPDSAEAYIAGVGVVRLGEIRDARTGEVDEREATLRYWESRATANLCREPCQSEHSGDTQSEAKRLTA